jgi:hypothetical protein
LNDNCPFCQITSPIGCPNTVHTLRGKTHPLAGALAATLPFGWLLQEKAAK